MSTQDLDVGEVNGEIILIEKEDGTYSVEVIHKQIKFKTNTLNEIIETVFKLVN
jgi:hypothetical protein